ncbi:hypothetical protein QYF36_006650 [Acer negundo]|nr:hypothetical protein QYF36_006650 [Acer negundo]
MYLCCFQNDHDPSKLVAETPSNKVEVMKICRFFHLPLWSSNLKWLKAGELIARAEPFHENLPILGPITAIYGKVHQQV